MITNSKAWNWEIVKGDMESKWLTPSQEVYYLIKKWQSENRKKILDLGCGIGRHSLLFSQYGFETYGLDLSENAILRAQMLAVQNNLNIDYKVGDMVHQPYKDETMDAIFAYYAISHTNTQGVKQILKEIRRILTENGECYLTLGSKDSWGFKENWPILDENTKIRIENGPDNNVPHFYADAELIFELFKDFKILDVRQIQKIEMIDGKIKDHHHYHVLAKKKIIK